jgi:tetratricopeptide (TPR) repeat protein
MLLACTACSRAQPLPAFATRIEMLRSEIKSATSERAGAEQMGSLWLRLANEYHNRFEVAQAEDAFSHAISLLRIPSTQAGYAESLEGLGSLYFETARPAEARACLGKALAIYQALGDGRHTAKLHVTLARVQLFERRFRESEAESSEALKELQMQTPPDAMEMAAALFAHGYALCVQGQCNAALDDTNRAMTLAKEVLAANSLEVAELWAARGFDEWKSGSPEEGERDMREALRMLGDRGDLPPLLLGHARLAVLKQYALCLKESHRKPEARQIEAEISQIESGQRLGCNGCTVSAAALSPELAGR